MPVISFLVHTGCSRLYSVFANQPTNGHPTQVPPKEPTARLNGVGQQPTDDDPIHKNNQTPMSKKRRIHHPSQVPCFDRSLAAYNAQRQSFIAPFAALSILFAQPSYPKTAISNPL